MNKKGLSVASILLGIIFFVSSVSMAEESYRSEISTSYSLLKHYHNSETKYYSAYFGFYLSEVNTEGHPLAEAAFLERVGMVSFGYGKSESDYNYGSFWGDGESTSSSFSLILQKPNFPITMRLSAGEFDSDADYTWPPSSYYYDGEGKNYGIGIGWYINDSLVFSVDYDKGEYNSKNNFGGTVNKDDLESKSYGISGKYVQKLSPALAFNLQLDYTKDEDKDDSGTDRAEIYSVNGDIYVNRIIGIGAGFSKTKGDNDSAEGESKSIKMSVFFTPEIALSLYHSIDDPKRGGSYHSKYTSGSLLIRF